MNDRSYPDAPAGSLPGPPLTVTDETDRAIELHLYDSNREAVFEMDAAFDRLIVRRGCLQPMTQRSGSDLRDCSGTKRASTYSLDTRTISLVTQYSFRRAVSTNSRFLSFKRMSYNSSHTFRTPEPFNTKDV
jgi:hypothetical protein